MARISLFSKEYLFNEYDFQKTHIALIVDTCGIGAKFSNMFFGTRFDEKGILSEDIWSGFLIIITYLQQLSFLETIETIASIAS